MPSPPPLLPSDPGANYRAHRREIDAAVRRVFESGRYVLGREVEAFEAEFARAIGAGECVGVASGTDALLLALRALDIGPGDAVYTVSHTAVATAAAIVLAGATPVLVDVDPASFTMDPARLEAALGMQRALRPRAVVPVHLYGHPADMRSIAGIAERRGLAIVEDCAQSHGAVVAGRAAGTWGEAAAFSFYPTKNLGAFGDGGALVARDAVVAERARALRQYGWRERYVSDEAGLNSRLDELQAAILRAKLPHLAEENARRRAIARSYDEALAPTGLGLPRVADGVTHAFHQYTVRTPDRDGLRAYLREHDIGASVLYPLPVHRQRGYRDRVVVAAEGLAETERLCGEILSLPMYPELRDEDVLRVAGCARRWSRTHA